MFRILLSLFVVMLVASPCMADTMTVGTKTYEGEFKGFENNQFNFKPEKGKEIRENRTKVKKLALDKPLKVSYEKRGKKPEEGVELLRYEKFKFVFKKDGKERKVLGNGIQKISVAWSGGNGFGLPSMERPKVPEPIDFQGIEGADLTPAQETALAAYKAARGAYDKYVNESSAMVTAMDASAGKRREELLNDLRIRKQDEQPLRNALQQATNDALAAFPVKAP